MSDYLAWRTGHGGVARRIFPPEVVVDIKALACELPSQSGIALSRYSVSEIRDEIIKRGIVASIGQTTLWRLLHEDAIRPWFHRSWIFPRDPHFAERAGRVLDLYQGFWHGQALSGADQVISADEKTSIQARCRRHQTLPPGPGRIARVENEYKRHGALAYFAAWDVHNARIFGRCESKTGIVPFSRLVELVMSQEPYRSAPRVFWILDNGSSHRGTTCATRLETQWPNIIPVHLPIHASWLNQIEIYFSIIQRKLLTPNDFRSSLELEESILAFQAAYQQKAKPFDWKYTRKDLKNLMKRLDQKQPAA